MIEFNPSISLSFARQAAVRFLRSKYSNGFALKMGSVGIGIFEVVLLYYRRSRIHMSPFSALCKVCAVSIMCISRVLIIHVKDRCLCPCVSDFFYLSWFFFPGYFVYYWQYLFTVSGEKVPSNLSMSMTICNSGLERRLRQTNNVISAMKKQPPIHGGYSQHFT